MRVTPGAARVNNDDFFVAPSLHPNSPLLVSFLITDLFLCKLRPDITAMDDCA